MSGLETVESTEGPNTGIILTGVLVSALEHLSSDLGLLTILAQLFHQAVNVESGVLEQTHFVENATNVAAGLLVIGEVPFLVFGYGFIRNAQRGRTLWSVADKVLLCLDVPFLGVVGVHLMQNDTY